ncbi:MAG: hypothetical protein VX640_06500 [Pseudomonadota bacterium]|nr:hypothetical protein [Pseudomonadota bacterium]
MNEGIVHLFGGGRIAALAGASIVLVLMGVMARAILTSRRLEGSSLFNRLFVVVAVTSGFFSAVSSAIGFSLITSQETDDFFRNSVLPPAFGVFVFCLAVAIWVGGAELVRHRDWFRNVGAGPFGDALSFIERAFKLFVVIPILAAILFLVSTWTTVVGIGGVDAVRHTYGFEIERLQAECAGIAAYRQRDFLFLEDLRLSVEDVRRAAQAELTSGRQTGSAGRGVVSDYFSGVADWYAGLEASVAALIDADDPSGVSPFTPDICANTVESLKRLLARNAFDNYDLWAREFETAFNDFAIVLNRWRQDRRIETLLDQQLAGFARANPKPVGDARGRVTPSQMAAIDRYAEEVENAVKKLISRQRREKPPAPIPSAAELSPERGMMILYRWFVPAPLSDEEGPARRTQAVVKEEVVPGLSALTPRDAVLKNANIFSDVWALALAWDYAAYILMLAYLFFPSAERAAGFKDSA